MLADGGVFRLIVPDLYERARIYVSTARQKPDSAEQFIRATMLGKEYRPRNLSEILHDIVGNSNHLWMWDETSLAMELAKQGFTMIRRCNLGDSGIAMFDAVEKSSRFYDNDLGIQECAMEARKYLKNDPVVD